MRFSATSGIAIGPILFVVAILAILATAIAAGSSTFSSGSDQEAARVNASAIIDVATTLRAAVARVTALGCSDTQISFENSVVSGYTNSNAPADYHCHIFDTRGGGMVWTSPPSAAFEVSTTGFSPRQYFFDGSKCVSGINSNQNYYGGSGTLCMSDGIGSNAQLVLVTTDIRDDVCNSINTLLGINSLSLSSGVWGSQFTGSYTKDITRGFDASTTVGKMMGCAQAHGSYIYFYAILLIR